MSERVLAHKRVFVVREAGEIRIAGAYALQSVPMNAFAPEGTWYSAFLNRLDARRYTPLTEPIATVEFGGACTEGRGPGIVTGTQQRVLALELHPLCRRRGCTEAVKLWQWEPSSALELTVLAGHCSMHRTDSQNADLDTLETPYILGSTTLARYQRHRNESQRDPRSWCGCSTLSELGADSGIAFYLRELWDLRNATAQPDGSYLVQCRRCTTTWLYLRKLWPPAAHKLG